MTPSVGRRGQCWDDAVAESFFATLKTELIQHRAWPTRKAPTSAIFNYIEGWYNTRRRHSTLSYLSPATFESTRATRTPRTGSVNNLTPTLSVEPGQPRRSPEGELGQKVRDLPRLPHRGARPRLYQR